MARLNASRITTVAAMLGVLALVSWAAPMIPERPGATPGVMSLSEVQKLQVYVHALPPSLRDVGTNADALRSVWVEQLRNAGFEVVADNDEDTPRLVLQFMTATDAAIPDALGFCAFMALEQPVLVERLDYRMTAATFKSFAVGLETRVNLRAALEGATADLGRFFISSQRLSRPPGE